MEKRGVTLIEVTIGILVGSLLVIGVSRLFSGGLKITQKGSSHLTNMQAAAVLMLQIEQDLNMGTKIQGGGAGSGDVLQIEMADTSETFGKLATSTVRYEPTPDRIGFKRTFSGCEVTGAPPQEHLFGSGLLVEVKFEIIQLAEADLAACVRVRVGVKNPLSGSEENRLERLVYCQNLPENRRRQTRAWRW